MAKTYDPDFPIVLGLAGEAATGKTVTANGLAPAARVVKGDEEGIYWEHLYFAMPLYQMSNARQTIEGDRAFDRILYQIHNTLLEVWPGPAAGAPPYDELIEMVFKIAEYPCPKEGKPREFLQHVGTDICRDYDPDCWVAWMKQKVQREFASWRLENRPQFNYSLDPEEIAPDEVIDRMEEEVMKYGVVISDCRFPNEAEWIHNHPNGILVKLEATDEVLIERQLERDGAVMTESQKSHASELGVSQIPLEWFDHIMDTSEMSVKEQVYAVNQLAHEFIGA